MISYQPFYNTLFSKNITEYQLIFKHGINASTLQRIRQGDSITMKTLDVLCDVLDCEVSEVIEHIKEQ